MTYFAGLDNLSRNWEGWHLPKLLVGDASAAFLSATAISPIITAIDRFDLRLHMEVYNNILLGP